MMWWLAIALVLFQRFAWVENNFFSGFVVAEGVSDGEADVGVFDEGEGVHSFEFAFDT